MKEIHLDRNEKIEDIGENGKHLKLYGEITLDNIKLLKNLNQLNWLKNRSLARAGLLSQLT